MKDFTLQLQCGQECNLNCLHCWREAKSDGIKLKLNFIDKQITELYDHLLNKNIDNFHLKFSGGEPLIYINDIINLLKKIDIKKRKKIKIHILTNGTLINKKIIGLLEEYKQNLFLQISIDGLRKTHNKIRGESNFEISYKNAIYLHKLGYNIRLQAVINKYNIKELKQIIKLFCLSPMPYFQIRKTINIGNAKNFQNNKSTTREMYRTVASMLGYIKENHKTIGLGCDSAKASKIDKSLEDITYTCSVAKKEVMGIEPNGDILVCPRVAIKIGNIYKDDIVYVLNNVYDKKLNIQKNKCLSCNEFNGEELCYIYNNK